MTTKKNTKKPTKKAAGKSKLATFPGFVLEMDITTPCPDPLIGKPDDCSLDRDFEDPMFGHWNIYEEDHRCIAMEAPCGEKYIAATESLRYFCTTILAALKKAGV